MKITIIIPVYNVEPYIEDCLKSVAAQTYNGDIECIIVNDCTPDNSCAIIEEFIGKYNGNIKFKLLHHKENRGLSAARNTGIYAATGEYIYFLDSDDEITSNCIALLSAPLKEKKYDFVIGDYCVVGADRNNFPSILVTEDEMPTNTSIRKSYFAYKWYVMAVNKLYNAKFIQREKLLFKEGIIHEDDLWSFQLSCLAQTMYVVREETYIYKIRNNSITNSSLIDKRISSISLITEEAKRWTTMKGILYDKDVFRKVLSFRELALNDILSIKSYSKKKSLYLKHYKKIRISLWNAFLHRVIKTKSLVKELYNYLPGILGLWYINLYTKIFKR